MPPNSFRMPLVFATPPPQVYSVFQGSVVA